MLEISPTGTLGNIVNCWLPSNINWCKKKKINFKTYETCEQAVNL